MDVLVFIKQVADTEARILINEGKKGLEIENRYQMNFFDEFALEEAIRIKEQIKGTSITVCTYGMARVQEVLRTAIAMGADRAYRIESSGFGEDDPLTVARVLTNLARDIGYDLILCGRQAIDDENGATGIMVAELLGIPHVSSVVGLEFIEEGKIRVKAEVEGGKIVVNIAMPALLTIQKGINEPRVPLITGVMKAMKTEIPVIEPASIGIKEEDLKENPSIPILIAYEIPGGRPPVRFIDGAGPEEKAKGLIRALKEEAKVI